ncbi:MAG: tetratricopeptide repeat protein [Thermoanaerobaculia bacterium]|nr:tetratricopeptide repeat protein [Thermoanaerobaculia bacterium]
MNIDRRTGPGGARILGLAMAALVAFAGPLAAKDVYKGFLDPGIPQHRATLDLLERLEKAPNDASLHNDLACLIARDGFWRDAFREFGIAAKLDKTDGRPLYNAGLVHAMRGEWGGAASSFKKAVSRAPGNWAAWWMLGYAEERRGNDSAAIAAYKTSLRVDTSLFDVRRNPFAAYTRLKGRVLLESLDGRLVRASLPVTEQMAEAGLVGSFQQGRVAVSAVPGGLAPGGPAPGAAGGPAPDDHAMRPGPGGAVVTSVPPVSTSRPAPPPNASSAPPTPAYTRANELIPSEIPPQSPAGPAKKRSPAPRTAPGDREDAPAAPAPAPPRPGPGVG